jgi:hypothetical protein
MIKIQVNRPIGYRTADIGPGGKEYNVKTDSAWDDHIREIYDQNPNLTLKELSQKTGLSINKLKTILMGRQ